MSLNLENELLTTKKAAILAGIRIIEVYNTSDFETKSKGEYGPVTKADNLSNIELCSVLNSDFPEYGILTEEETDPSMVTDGVMKAIGKGNQSDRSWIIDPLDGTSDFLLKNGEFGVHIGLVENGIPILGLNYYPTENKFYYAISGGGAFVELNGKKTLIQTEIENKLSNLEIIVSRNHPDANILRFAKENLDTEPVKFGGMGLKICKIAENLAGLYVLFSDKPGIWDSCSSDIILSEAGGTLVDLKGNKINYQFKETNLSNGLIATRYKDIDVLLTLINQYRNIL